MTMPRNESQAVPRQTTRRGQSSNRATARKLKPVSAEAAELTFEAEKATVVNQEVEMRRQERLQRISRLQEKRDSFVDRLDTGAAKIEESRAQGKDVTLWEDFWIDLLRQYEAVCQQLRDLHTQPLV